MTLEQARNVTTFPGSDHFSRRFNLGLSVGPAISLTGPTSSTSLYLECTRISYFSNSSATIASVLQVTSHCRNSNPETQASRTFCTYPVWGSHKIPRKLKRGLMNWEMRPISSGEKNRTNNFSRWKEFLAGGIPAGQKKFICIEIRSTLMTWKNSNALDEKSRETECKWNWN